MRFRIAAVLMTTLPLVGCGRLPGNSIPKSQAGAVFQRVAQTEITVVYNRPVARGRVLFGGIVPWGTTWDPGADRATTIEVSDTVEVQGATLPAGIYSLWAIPDSLSWTIIFSRAHDVFHEPYPEGQDALRVTTTPERGDYMETLAYYFPLVEGRHAQLNLHWGATVVPLSVDVP